MPSDRTFLVAHIVFRFDYGGLENGVVNIVNGLAGGPFRHVVIALTESTAFQNRLVDNVEVYSLRKRPGKDLAAYWRLYRLLRRLSPDVVHTRNFGTLECALVAFLAGVPVRIHGEHGWDVTDPDGSRKKFQVLRRILFRIVDQVIAVSRDLQKWLVNVVGVPTGKVRYICNGVDTERFTPRTLQGKDCTHLTFGSVTRFAEIKDPMNLVEAFVAVRKQRSGLRLVMVGDGPLAVSAASTLVSEGLDRDATLLGFRDDIPELLRDMDVFVLGSLREGVSNTVLEAMATGLPVIATDTGGNRELIADGVNGLLVPPGDRDALAAALCFYLNQPQAVIEHGGAARERAVSKYSISAMTNQYGRLYGEMATVKGR
jgi:sugar transferase (PEP-CTERM/EpsH1 system associated)